MPRRLVALVAACAIAACGRELPDAPDAPALDAADAEAIAEDAHESSTDARVDDTEDTGTCPAATNGWSSGSDADSCLVWDGGACPCVFPSGRLCPSHTDCTDDDGCNTCTCDGVGGLSCTKVGCAPVYADAGACEDASATRCRETPIDLCRTGFGYVVPGLPRLMLCPPSEGDACPVVGCRRLSDATDRCGTFWCCP